MSTDLTNQEKLEEIYKLSLENNEMLHRLQSRGRLTAILQILYWLIIVGSLAGAYYYVRPLVNTFTTNGTKAEGLLNQFQELRSQFPETKAFQEFYNQLRTQTPDTGTSTTDASTTSQ